MKKNSSPLTKAIKKAYQSGQEDEALNPITVWNKDGKPVGRMKDGDYVIFYDIRGEREIELTESLTAEQFSHFQRKENTILNFVTMIEYSSELDVDVAFPPEEKIENTLSEVLGESSIPVFKIAESEKAVHIDYFMNGKTEEPFPHERKITIPSPEIGGGYDQSPELSASKVTDRIIETIENEKEPFFIAANLANVDVIGHIENKAAVLKAIRCVDNELNRIVNACEKNNVVLAVTADHGTVEDWHYPDGSINTGHTKSPVPFILADFSLSEAEKIVLKSQGELRDIAPTILNIFGIKIPGEMTGENLVLKNDFTGKNSKRFCLLILDGWGMGKESNGNMIIEAGAESFNSLWEKFPHSSLEASGEAVGMPPGTVGNSEAGHLHIGAGRRVLLDRVKIDNAIKDHSFYSNQPFLNAMEKACSNNKALHLLGIVSHYSSHGSIDHLFALLELAKQKGVKEVYVHSLIGRRGERPESGSEYISLVEKKCEELNLGNVVTVMGRYWALDREYNWPLVEKAYRALVFGDGEQILS